MPQSNPPLVSIVTPCYNSARFLEVCIRSVLAQDYPCIEHIVQDSASTDGTREILQRYDRRIDWVSEPDRGQAHGLDRALKRSRGDIILVLNADDMLLPHAASWAVENMAKYPEMAVIYGDLYIINVYGEISGAQFGVDPYNFEKVLCVEQVLPAQASFMRRLHLEQVGLGTDATMDTCPDYEMWVRIGRRFPMRHVPGFVGKYRSHPHPDGRQPRSVKRFIRAKQKVMDGIFNDPTVSSEIRALRNRAYSSLALWGAFTAYYERDLRGCFRETARSLYLQPVPKRIGQVLGLLRMLITSAVLSSQYKADDL